MKLDEMSYIIYTDIKSLIKKINGYGNSPENSSATKMSKNIPCGYSMLTIWAFNQIENKHIILQKRLYEKVWWIFKRTRETYNWFWKEKKNYH